MYRHPIDVHFSFRDHVANMREAVLGGVYPPDPSESFRIFLAGALIDAAGWRLEEGGEAS